MSALLAGLPVTVPGETVNRLCASGLSAIAGAARAIKVGEGDVYVAGGSESMTRAPYVLSKSAQPFGRAMQHYDSALGWRFVNPAMKSAHGTDSMGETAENVAEQYHVTRADQDAFALRSQQKAGAAMHNGRFASEITPVSIPQRKGDPSVVEKDEHPRPQTTLEALAKLPAPFRQGGSVTAGNASGVNDGAAALILASEAAAKAHRLTPIARILGGATAGVPPRIMGFGPVPASKKLMARLGLRQEEFDVIELNEAFASQGLATLRDLGIADDDPRVNPNGGAIALGHPLGMSGARIVGTAAGELKAKGGKRAWSTMCIGVGQGIAAAIEAV
jgi:3-oxoadipyl-CoA thiolase